MKKLSISNKLPDSNSKYVSPLPDSDHPYGRASAVNAPSLCMIFPGNALKLMLTDSQSSRHSAPLQASGAISMGMKIDMNERTTAERRCIRRALEANS